MHSNSQFTKCDICHQSISTGEKHLTLNFHKETGSIHSGRKSIQVQFAVCTMTTCMSCGKPLAAFVLSDDLKEQVNLRRLSGSATASEEEYVRKERLSEVEELS